MPSKAKNIVIETQDMPARAVTFAGYYQAMADEFDELKRQGKGKYLGGSADCVRLPQTLTDVGWTGFWRRGPRVIDQDHVLPGTVVANFKMINGEWRFPNESGYHAALFDQFWHGALMADGLPCQFSIFDQYHGKPAGRRGLAIIPEWLKKSDPRMNTASNQADAFYIVLVP